MSAPGSEVGGEARPRERADGSRRDEVEPALEGRPGRRMQRDLADVGVRIAVADERERSATEPLDLEHGIEPAPARGQRPHRQPGKYAVAWTAAGRIPPALVQEAQQLGVEPDSGGEGEAPPVHAAERDPALPSQGELPSSRHGVAR